MGIIYNFFIHIIKIFLHFLKYFNSSILKFITERKDVFKDLELNISNDQKYIWIHVASLGEYEQGFPVFNKIKSLYNDHKIVISFFSSSGYNVQKSNPISNLTIYLPIDTAKNANKFLDLLKPKMVFFVKYEFWPNFLKSLKNRNIPTYLIAGIFREDHWFFNFYGLWMKNNLKAFHHFFVQNESSKNILLKQNFTNCTVMGDSRYDRVIDLPSQNNEIKYLNDFKGDKKCFVGGSTWEKDESLIIKFINSYEKNDVCFIIAPHQINSNRINKLKKLITKNTILMSELAKSNAINPEVIIIDSIGLLTKVYSYANIAYVGGGMGNTGLHNTLEPAVFKIPVIIGNNFEKFPEAKELIDLKGMISINNITSFTNELNELLNSKEKRDQMGNINYDYINTNLGTYKKVINYLKEKK
ncbi:MAG: 3-deoxy-D-manno-octulosonic acid transferase [Flavobacteriaceae bacterium]|nr:3-deoxy-D-manno-octulosonic acid transferase [Flavobacteriaceae bacterium]